MLKKNKKQRAFVWGEQMPDLYRKGENLANEGRDIADHIMQVHINKDAVCLQFWKLYLSE